MTTMREIHTEDIYLKGVPIKPQIDEIVNINAVIAGLFGGQPSSPAAPEPIIQTRAPTATDDVSENWDVGSIWVSDQGYVCLDNTEGKAVWKVCSLEIGDDANSKTMTYSSQKIEFLLLDQLTQTDNKLSLKADKTDVYTIAELDIELGEIIEKVTGNCFTYTNNKVGLVTTDLSDYKDTIQITVNEIEAAIGANATDLNNYKITMQNTIDDVEVGIGANATDLNNYKILMQNTVGAIESSIETNATDISDYKDTIQITVNEIEAAIGSNATSLNNFKITTQSQVTQNKLRIETLEIDVSVRATKATVFALEAKVDANATDFGDYKILIQNTINDINAAIADDVLTLKEYRASMRTKIDNINAEIASNTSRIEALEGSTASASQFADLDTRTIWLKHTLDTVLDRFDPIYTAINTVANRLGLANIF